MKRTEQLVAYIQNRTPNRVYESVGGKIIIQGNIPNSLLQELRGMGKLERLYEDTGFALTPNKETAGSAG